MRLTIYFSAHADTYTVSLLPKDSTPSSVHQLTLTDKILRDQLGLVRSHTFPCCQITSLLLTKFASNSLNYALLRCENIILRSTGTNNETYMPDVLSELNIDICEHIEKNVACSAEIGICGER